MALAAFVGAAGRHRGLLAGRVPLISKGGSLARVGEVRPVPGTPTVDGRLRRQVDAAVRFTSSPSMAVVARTMVKTVASS